mgnify:CR=1 FL=1
MGKIPFCPNPSCACHTPPPHESWFRPNGYYPTRAFGLVPRFICTSCHKSFSTQTFSTNYYAKKLVPLREIFLRHAEAQSGRAISRALHVSPSTIQNRLDRLARQSLALHARLRTLAKNHEDICIDGFVSFDRSQYFPSEITISVAARSQMVLEVSHASRRRSGVMTSDQAKKAHKLYGSVQLERGAVSRTFRDNLDTLAILRPPRPASPLVLITDEKPEYQHILFRHPLFRTQNADRRVAHIQVWSKLPRDRSNPLFPSNYIDRLIRKDQANHHRETVCYNRNVANGLSRLACYIAYHNYFKPFRINAKVTEKRTHGEASGIDQELIKKQIGSLFKNREFLSKSNLSPPLERIWRKAARTPMKNYAEYMPKFAYS